MPYWLIVERLENWQVDLEEKFARFGVPERKRVLATNVRKGDFLVTYISSGMSSFSDLREVTGTGLERLGMSGGYDTAFPYALKTRPVIVLENQVSWVKVHELRPQLEFLKAVDWRQALRTSLKRLSDRDGKVIRSALAVRARRAIKLANVSATIVR